MKLIAITTPSFDDPNEVEIWERLFEEGLERLHVRKLMITDAELSGQLNRLNPAYYDRVVLHNHFSLAARFGLAGVHLNMRHPTPPRGWKGSVSRSCHTIEELDPTLDYCFLSPIFDSLSKPGYTSRFTERELRSANLRNVFALGGVTAEHFDKIKNCGFAGAAVLGAIWTGDPIKNWQKLWKNSSL